MKLVELSENFKPYDYYFMLRIERQMLKQMQEYHEQSKICEENPIIARQIKWAIRLLDIMEDWIVEGVTQYFDNNIMKTKGEPKLTVYVNKRNSHRFVNYDINSIYVHASLRETKAWYLYNKIRFYHLRNWWD